MGALFCSAGPRYGNISNISSMCVMLIGVFLIDGRFLSPRSLIFSFGYQKSLDTKIVGVVVSVSLNDY